MLLWRNSAKLQETDCSEWTLKWVCLYCWIWKSSENQEGRRLPFLNSEVTKSHPKDDDDLEFSIGWFRKGIEALKTKLPNSVPSQVNVRTDAIDRLYNVKLHVFKSSGERAYNSDNENIYHPKFAKYAERSSLVDTNPKSYHLIAYELVNPLLYTYFPSFEYRIFFERSEVCYAVVCCVVNS